MPGEENAKTVRPFATASRASASVFPSGEAWAIRTDSRIYQSNDVAVAGFGGGRGGAGMGGGKGADYFGLACCRGGLDRRGYAIAMNRAAAPRATGDSVGIVLVCPHAVFYVIVNNEISVLIAKARNFT